MDAEGAPTVGRLGFGLAPALIVSLAAHIVVAVLGVIAAPIFLRQLGAAGYGLFGFYAVLQSAMILFDLGLTPALARQLSRYRAGVLHASDAAGLWKATELLFLFGAGASAAVFFVGSGWIASHWLGPSHLARGEVSLALQIAGFMMAGRWMAVLYLGALIGLNEQIGANVILLGGAIVRTISTVAALWLLSPTPVTFFAVQSILTLAEAGAYRFVLSKKMPRPEMHRPPAWGLLSREIGFAASMAASSVLAAAINQSDKFALSHVLPLTEFGFFSLVAAICTGIGLLVPPLLQVFQPTLTSLLAQDRQADFAQVYRIALALVVALAAGLAGTIAAEPALVIFAWTGDRALGQHLAPVLSLYALGAGINAFLFVPFLLQYARGRIPLHLIGNALLATVSVPAAVWAAYDFGMIGTGIVWLGGNLLYLILWVPVVHRRLLSNADRRGIGVSLWLRVVVLGALLGIARLLVGQDVGRIEAVVLLTGLCGLVTGLGLVASRELRKAVRQWLHPV